MNYTYRLATFSDLPTLRRLWRDYMTETRLPYPHDMLGFLDDFTRQLAIAMAQSPCQVFAFLCEHQGEPVGFLLYEIQRRSMGRPERYGFCHGAYVDPAHRRVHIVEALGALAGEHMLAQDLVESEITTLPGDEWAAFAGYEAFQVRYHAPIAASLLRVDKRRAGRTAAETGNGLDHQPLSAEQPEPKDATTEEP